MISTFGETIFTNKQEYFTTTTRTIIFLILSTSLLTMYGLQKQNFFDTQIIIWIIFTLLFSGISYIGPQSGALNTMLLVLISISGGMVLANSSITVKV
jgi:hypothetical protein